MKSVLMALWLLAVSAGNGLLVWFHNWKRSARCKTKITDLQFFEYCTGVMFVAAGLFVIVASFYKGRTYLQGEAEIAEADIAAVITRMPA